MSGEPPKTSAAGAGCFLLWFWGLGATKRGSAKDLLTLYEGWCEAGKGQDCLCARPCPLPAVPAPSSPQQGPSHPVRRKASLQIPLWGITINFLHSPSAVGHSWDERPERPPGTEQGTRSCACGQQKARSSIPRPPGLRVCDSAPRFGRRKKISLLRTKPHRVRCHQLAPLLWEGARGK